MIGKLGVYPKAKDINRALPHIKRNDDFVVYPETYEEYLTDYPVKRFVVHSNKTIFVESVKFLNEEESKIKEIVNEIKEIRNQINERIEQGSCDLIDLGDRMKQKKIELQSLLGQEIPKSFTTISELMNIIKSFDIDHEQIGSAVELIATVTLCWKDYVFQ